MKKRNLDYKSVSMGFYSSMALIIVNLISLFLSYYLFKTSVGDTIDINIALNTVLMNVVMVYVMGYSRNELEVIYYISVLFLGYIMIMFSLIVEKSTIGFYKMILEFSIMLVLLIFIFILRSFRSSLWDTRKRKTITKNQ